ncbi:hypothetical protein BG262_02830 [Floricoccus penangensis]|uniref:ATP-dependent Clp protease proteolytic subunit n=1 Tax=Floricoccus penangensis TaxID=1859475 RepID=A0A9Q5P0T1_9LACT|nr:head maturation protease, ClpP-related [Floricoccus penangensis]OFI46749.1 hypothetical protein BG262_02830 [Floricoccus penangensis]
MADLRLSGVVGWEITADKVDSFLKDNKDDEITVYINSPGGDVFEGLEVYNLLRASGKKVTTVLTGLSASMGSIIFLAGDERIAMTGSLYMVHKPSSMAWGDANDLKKSAEVLDKVQESLEAIYKERAGISDISDYINNETWWGVSEMTDKGIANSDKHVEFKLDEEERKEEDLATIEELRAQLEAEKIKNQTLTEENEKAELEKQIADLKKTNEDIENAAKVVQEPKAVENPSTAGDISVEIKAKEIADKMIADFKKEHSEAILAAETKEVEDSKIVKPTGYASASKY